MTKYVAFVRGINVDGNKLVKMKDLCGMFSGLGFGNVSSYKAAGNIIFDASGSSKAIAQKIEKELHKLMGKETKILLRTMDELKGIVRLDPFRGVKDPEAKRYVTFLEEELKGKPELPLKSENGDALIVAAKGREIYSLTCNVGGRYGNPLDLIDEYFGKALITTRNWNTVAGIAAED
jgi:uncharacterized protein (DUF1697 family)